MRKLGRSLTKEANRNKSEDEDKKSRVRRERVGSGVIGGCGRGGEERGVIIM